MLWSYKLVEANLHTFLTSTLNGSALAICGLKKIDCSIMLIYRHVSGRKVKPVTSQERDAAIHCLPTDCFWT
jgi:hypothetical protein